MRIGDLVEVDMRFGKVTGKVLKSSDEFYLHFQDVNTNKKYYIGVVPGLGNPKIKIKPRLNRGLPVKTCEYIGYLK